MNYKLSFFPFTLYFSSFSKAKAKVYIFIVVAVRSDVNIFSSDFGHDRFRMCVLIALISFILKVVFH